MAVEDAIRVQAAYDELPQELRELLAGAPIKVSSEFVLGYYRRNGLRDTIERVKQGIADATGGQ